MFVSAEGAAATETLVDYLKKRGIDKNASEDSHLDVLGLRYDARKREGWDAKRLTPLLAGLDQLLPWIHQWHPALDPEFGETAGQSFQTVLEQDAHELGLTLEDIKTWKPENQPRRRGGRRTAES